MSDADQTVFGKCASDILEAVKHTIAWTAKGPMDLTDVINQTQHAVRKVLPEGYKLLDVSFHHADPSARILRQTLDHINVTFLPNVPQARPSHLFVPVGDAVWKPKKEVV